MRGGVLDAEADGELARSRAGGCEASLRVVELRYSEVAIGDAVFVGCRQAAPLRQVAASSTGWRQPGCNTVTRGTSKGQHSTLP